MNLEDTKWHEIKRLVAMAEMEARAFFLKRNRSACRRYKRLLRKIIKQTQEAWKEAVNLDKPKLPGMKFGKNK